MLKEILCKVVRASMNTILDGVLANILNFISCFYAMKTAHPSLPDILIRDFQRKKKRNRNYSVRAYARYLNISASTLLNLMKGKSSGSKEVIRRFSRKLSLTENDCVYLLKSAELNRTKNVRKRKALRNEVLQLDTSFNRISEETFQHLGFWQCFAVMELIKIKGARLDPAWIAERLCIPEAQATAALNALVGAKVIEISESGKLTILTDFITLPSGKRLDLARNFHGELIKKGREALFNQSENDRNISSLILRFNSSRMNEVDEFIREFRRKFSAAFEEGDDHDAVCGLGIQFFRLDQVGSQRVLVEARSPCLHVSPKTQSPSKNRSS